MKNLLSRCRFLLGLLLVVSFVSSAGADPAPLTNNRHIFVNVANDAGVKYDLDGAKYAGPSNTYYIKADSGGTNSEWLAPLATDTTGVATTVTSASPAPSGTLYLNDAGGRGYSDDIILLLSVRGPIADNFSVNIKSSGYTWTPASAGAYNPVKPTASATGAVGTATSPLAGALNGLPIQGVGLVYQPVVLDETFTKADFIYGPQSAKPGPGGNGVTPSWTWPLYPGQNIADPSTAEYLMFVDLKAGAIRDTTLVDNGAVRVDYSFNNLYGDASVNMYGWVIASNQGQGISFTTPSTTNGYTVSYTGPPVASVTYSTPGPYKAGTNVIVTATFSKNLVDAPVPMITLAGADTLTANMTKIDANHYSYSYLAGSGNGDVAVTLSGTDLAANPVTFVPASGATFRLDNTLPTVNSSTPADGATDVDLGSQITVTFSEAMDATTVSSDSFLVNGVAGLVTYNADTRTATFTPNTALANSTQYTVVIGAVKDLAGNAVTSANWSFTTAAPPDTTPPAAVISYAPVGPYKAGILVTVTATFSEAMADSPVPRVTLSGADTVAVTDMTKIDINHYSYSYTAGAGNGEVAVALSSGTDLAGNPVVSVPTSGGTFILDNISPTLSTSAPANGATNAGIDSQISATFSEAMDPATITSGTFLVNGVAGSVSYDTATRVARLTPNAALANSTQYTVTIGAVKDLAGNAMTPASWSFTTAAPPDTTPPTASLTYAPAGPYLAGTAVTITASFSEAMAASPVPRIALSGADTLSPVDMVRTDVNHYSYRYTVGSGLGEVTVALAAGTDLAGNPVVPVPTSGNTFTLTLPMGNMRGDATVTIADALMALRSVVGLYTPTAQEISRGDVGPLVGGKPAPDGKIDIGDAVVILRKVVGLENW